MTGSAWPRGLGVQPDGVADYPGFERLGTEEAAGDAREDQGDVPGAEGGRSAAERGGELFAEVDELADEAEEAAGAAGLWVDGGLSGGHEQTRNTRGRRDGVLTEWTPPRHIKTLIEPVSGGRLRPAGGWPALPLAKDSWLVRLGD